MIMRKILLFAILMVGFFLPTYSQLDSRPQINRLKIDTTFTGLSLRNNLKTPSPFDNKDMGWLFNDSIHSRKSLKPKIPDKKIKIGQDLFSINTTTQTFDKMPCVNPQGFSPMPIFVPDSTVKYSLQIVK